MPLKFWDEAFLAATFLINRTPSRVIDFETPLDRLYHTKPDYTALRIFGCACWPNLRPYNKHKLAFRSKECVFLGYSNLHKGFKCLDISSGRIYISRDVIFDENVFPFSRLHENAGARLRSEILLLSPSLLNPSDGDECVGDHVSNGENTNQFDEDSGALQEETGPGAETSPGAGFGADPAVLQHLATSGSGLDLATAATGSEPDGSVSGSAPSQPACDSYTPAPPPDPT
jgi:hypothetical protein